MTQNANVEILLQQGHEQLEQGQYEAAIETYHQAAQLEPQNPQALYGLGLAGYRLERYQESVEYLTQALQIKPDYLWAFLWRGRAYQQLKLIDQATADFKQAIQIKPQDYQDWRGQGDALNELQRYEEAVTSYEKALELQPYDPEVWDNYRIALLALLELSRYEVLYQRGRKLFDLNRYEEAIASYNKALELKSDDPETWYSRGNALLHWGRYGDAIASYDSALALAPQYIAAWNGKGNVLRSLDRDEEAIKAYDQALELSEDQYWRAWKNRGWAIRKQRGYTAALQNWDTGLQHLWHSDLTDNEGDNEAYGELHYCKGKAHCLEGRKQRNPFLCWRKAKTSYQEALQFLTKSQLPVRHLEVLQDLIIVCRGLGESKEAHGWLLEGTELLEQLLQDTSSPRNKIRLKRKFAGFEQLIVDELAQSSQPQKQIEALERAEQRKNLCLSWFRHGWSDAPPSSPKYQAIQNLLNPHSAAIYWHVSPAAITTFILTYNQSPLIVRAKVIPTSAYPAAASQIRDCENWVKAWKRDYRSYCNGKEKDINTKQAAQDEKKLANTNHPWRWKMAEKLEELATILDIPRILQYLSDIDQLILIPHRDLHLLPLHYLFHEQDFTITYLPSAQIGIALQQSRANPGQQLLNVENPQNDLRYATVESAAISLLYLESTIPLKGEKATRIQVVTTMQTDEQLGVFHFTGHGQHDINQPLESSLLLAGEDKLTLRDIFQLDLSRYHLICLSACETALTSKQGLIDEFVGLVSGFLAKGAAYVISALWAVDEYSTALLVVRFYQCLQADMTPPFALKEAQKWLRTVTYSELMQWYQDLIAKFEVEGKNQDIVFDLKSQVRGLQRQKNSATINPDQPPYAHPYYWAGFTVTGKV
jgi:CHAT domain-containing protein/tetratricopeptide (TPR) repeat protein